MKSFFAVICFLVCMLSAWASAEEPGKYPADTAKERKSGSASSLAERNEQAGIRLADRELLLVKGRAVKTGMSHVPETGERRIVLWDEGSGNTDRAMYRGSGQSMITIHR